LGTPFNPTAAGGTGLFNDGSQYIFDWQTKGLTAGTYEILLTLADGTLHTKVLQLTKNGSSAGLTTTAGGGTGTAPGGLLGGDIDLYVDNTNSDLTAEELARIQDAVTAADAVTEPYGVAVTEVTDPTLADVSLNMDTTSAVGGYADGVLGCTTDAGQITIISGWNFYAGSDATQIGSGQYDFETVVTHELGHALGLGHSTDSTSVMYATLNTGTVNRSLKAADLNVPDTGTTGACGLHAVSPRPASPNGGGLQTSSAAAAGTMASSGSAPLTTVAARDLLFALLGSDPRSGIPDVNRDWTAGTGGARAVFLEYGPPQAISSFLNLGFAWVGAGADVSPGAVAASDNSGSDALPATQGNSSQLLDGAIPAEDSEGPAASPSPILSAATTAPSVAMTSVFAAGASANQPSVPRADDADRSAVSDEPPVDTGLAWAGVLGLLMNAEAGVRRAQGQKRLITVKPSRA
jgi:hypothetical protein